ncbi:SWIM zinc finger protein [Breznakia blatticola]|uniref:SWIM zinc finger protein n=1 Tax=Breznakia blatticola TaxID=1754012 RepID=A0A4R7ZJB2_9FIRM|nr:SWIM zinc finger family protein [Breznakia blatticola]TDW16531.1 SWIM zinc finger protein [Breznakia blatticola]
MSRNYWKSESYYDQPSESTLKTNSSNSQKKMKEKGVELEPIIITGRSIANNWWGKAWCMNLERYADYDSRLPRGKRYVRMGTVIDLKIEKGKIAARVQGNRKTPYKIEVRISPLSEAKCQAIIQKSSHKIENLEALVSGQFPEELKDVFLSSEGLFPSPKEISFNCSCPDWANMCKHVAAVLYGVGARFDNDPLLFFRLRGIEVDRFIDVAIANKVESMLENVHVKSKRILNEDDISSLFGIL